MIKCKTLKKMTKMPFYFHLVFENKKKNPYSQLSSQDTGLGCGAVEEHLPCICEALGSTSSTKERERERERERDLPSI
jgi:hypothetical protein